jgi:GT2 family glycosyltransferase
MTAGDAAAPGATGAVDAVVIGRNEGARLVACLDALQGRVRQVFYVDSGSTDGSVAAASARGARVVTLDAATPFTAARARNAGLAAARAAAEPAGFVLFLDGDCTLQPGFLDAALRFMVAHPDIAVVCGRRRERHRAASLYNMLCDREWDTPVGEARACGGDALMRAEAVAAAGGYRGDLIAGEEPELCLRLRRAGWRVWRLDAEMTSHDAAIRHFGQWWRRSRRAGHAFAEGAALHGRGPERHWVRETRSALVWGALLPAAIVALAAVLPPALALVALYPVQGLRIARRLPGPPAEARIAAAFTVLGKFAEAHGVIGYNLARIRRRRTDLIEYK